MAAIASSAAAFDQGSTGSSRASEAMAVQLTAMAAQPMREGRGSRRRRGGGFIAAHWEPPVPRRQSAERSPA
jgi:hypothetical protein